MNRRAFFRNLLAAAATVVARAYVPSALAVATKPLDELPALSEREKLLRRYEALQGQRGVWEIQWNEMVAAFDESKWVTTYAEKLGLNLVEFRAGRPNRWDRRQRRLAARR